MDESQNSAIVYQAGHRQNDESLTMKIHQDIIWAEVENKLNTLLRITLAWVQTCDLMYTRWVLYWATSTHLTYYNKTDSYHNYLTTGINHIQACKSHDHDHEWTDYVMVWLPEYKFVRLMWEFDCLHFT